MVDDVFILQNGDIARLRDRVAAKINYRGGLNLDEFFEEFRVATGAWRIKDYGAVWRNKFCNVFGLRQDAFSVRASGVILHFGKSGAVNFDEREVFITGDGQTNAPYSSVKIEHFVGSDERLDGLEDFFVDWQIDLKEAIWRIVILIAAKFVAKRCHLRMRLAVCKKVARSMALLVATHQKRLISARLGVLGV